MKTRKQDSDATTTIMPSIAKANATSPTAAAKGRAALFQKSTRKNQEFERFLCNGQEAAVLDATTSKYIPLTYFVTPQNTTANHHTTDPQSSEASAVGGRNPPHNTSSEASAVGGRNPPHNTSSEASAVGGRNPPHNTSSEASAVGGRNPQRTPRHAHGLADKMPFESFRLINLQQRGNHAHSLVLFKSRAITTNPENIAIFECNGQYVQSEIRVIHTYHPDADAADEPGTVYDVTENYFAPISPKVCMNYGNDRYNPGYCGIFGMIAMTFYRAFHTNINTQSTSDDRRRGAETPWIKKWTQLLKYMRQDIPDEPECHGCMGIDLAARVQEIIAAHPSTATGHQNAEKEILREIKRAL